MISFSIHPPGSLCYQQCVSSPKQEIKRPDPGIIDKQKTLKTGSFQFPASLHLRLLKFRQTAFVFIVAAASLVRLMTLKSQFCQMVEDWQRFLSAFVALRSCENIELTLRWNVAKQAKRNI